MTVKIKRTLATQLRGAAIAALIGPVAQYTNADPRLDGSTKIDNCTSLRLPGSCKPTPSSRNDNRREIKIEGNKVAVKRQLTLPPQTARLHENACQPHFEISYFQANDQVKVDTQVQNDVCAASHGNFALSVRTVGTSGQVLTRSFPETWSRSDEEDVRLSKAYPMAGAQRLLSVRIKSNPTTACRCD